MGVTLVTIGPPRLIPPGLLYSGHRSSIGPLDDPSSSRILEHFQMKGQARLPGLEGIGEVTHTHRSPPFRRSMISSLVSSDRA